MGNGALLSALNEKILSFEEHLALRQSVIPFYEAVLSPKNVIALVEIATSDSWQSFTGEDKSKDRTTFIQHVEKFASTIPDLKWYLLLACPLFINIIELFSLVTLRK